MMKLFAKIIIINFFSLFSFVFFSCETDDIIPYVRFYERIYLDLPQYQTVKTSGNYLYLPADRFGYNGVILYCSAPDEYIAFERNCPHNASKTNAVLDVVDSVGLMVCRDCGSRFYLIDGLKLDGPSKFSAKIYNTSLLNNVLDIYYE